MNNSILKSDSIEVEFNGRKILQGVYLECRQGEILGLLGRNGCGKSTLLKVIYGTVNGTHKYVSIDDQFVHKGYLNNQIAYLPQHHFLPNGIKMRTLAKQMVDPEHWDEFSAYPVYRDHQHKTTTGLSGGEWRQLEMLMTLYSKARFILLDEPFTHVSPIQVEEIKTLILARAKTRGIIITDHYYKHVLEVSNRLLLLNNGYTKMIANRDDLVTYGYISE
ncbi:ATP-binding cassette domain-containing protein [Mucilaginibacter paludis]|uniref:ABC transporter related protein n=1 Tax=Mucilaginibacter paludis DSM 18603 TaxID=714943 RepID=H1Y1U9_9SPHI|nr:ATP-binding cassette domain-containing protein [Mucilaginibacter paludis]EHQ25652.1 ABC transporter related protein [Mucilaginibacter paludis DSM 18603]